MKYFVKDNNCWSKYFRLSCNVCFVHSNKGGKSKHFWRKEETEKQRKQELLSSLFLQVTLVVMSCHDFPFSQQQKQKSSQSYSINQSQLVLSYLSKSVTPMSLWGLIVFVNKQLNVSFVLGLMFKNQVVQLFVTKQDHNTYTSHTHTYHTWMGHWVSACVKCMKPKVT